MSRNIVFFDSLNDQKKEGRLFNDPWTPLEANPVAWFDASDLDTITEVIGNKVSEWGDKSGNGNHATQGSATEQPKTGVATIGGKNVITGNDASGRAYMNITGSSLVKSCFAVFDVSTSAAGGYIMSLGADLPDDADAEVFVRYGNNTDQTSFDGGGSNTGKYSLNGGLDSITAIGHTDSQIRTGSNIIECVSTSTFPLNHFIGRNDGNIGPTNAYKLGELIWFDIELSTIDKQKMEGYLAHKWSLTDNLSIAHPYKNEAPLI
jgi:hypothetical protein